jgi:hypothetical protein
MTQVTGKINGIHATATVAIEVYDTQGNMHVLQISAKANKKSLIDLAVDNLGKQATMTIENGEMTELEIAE